MNLKCGVTGERREVLNFTLRELLFAFESRLMRSPEDEMMKTRKESSEIPIFFPLYSKHRKANTLEKRLLTEQAFCFFLIMLVAGEWAVRMNLF